MHSTFYYSHDLARYDFGANHPFKPERAQKTLELCRRYGALDLQHISLKNPSPLKKEKILLAHSEPYLEVLSRVGKGEIFKEMLAFGIGTDDNPPLKGIYDWSIECAGATWEAMIGLLEDDIDITFNPLGGFHHALESSASGFCYINDIVIAIKDALTRDVKVTYLDIDAHHGNGVQEAFYNEDRVQFISIHESGKHIYPYSGFVEESGEGRGEGFTVNIPLPPNTDDEVYLQAFHRVVIPLINRFNPHIIFAEIGADTMMSDPLTDLMLTNNSYAEIIRELKKMSKKILATGGGGYDVNHTARCWALAWAILNDVEPRDEFAGLVGGMMFGPEAEVDSLYDSPYSVTGQEKDKIRKEVDEITNLLIKKYKL